MTDPAPGKTRLGRWIFLGCGGMTLLGAAGLAGILYFLYKQAEPLAAVGMEYLKTTPEVSEAFGGTINVKWKPMAGSVQLKNDRGTARLGYELSGPNGNGDADVYLSKRNGTWSADGALLFMNGLKLVGRPPDILIRYELGSDH